MNPLVLVHGLPDNSGTWEKLFPLLTPRFSKISIVGLPGIGDSESILDCSSFEDLADRLADRLPKEPSIYVGHDFGGILGTVIAERYPHLISKLVLINAPTPDILRNAIANDTDQAARSSYAVKIQKDPIQILQKNDFAFLKYYLFKNENNLSDGYKNSLESMWSNDRNLVNMGQYYNLILNSELKVAGDFNQPLLQVWSKCDPFLGEVVKREMREKFYSNEFIEIQSESHWLQKTNPEMLAEITCRNGKS